MPNLAIEAGPGTGKSYTLQNGRIYLTSPITTHIKRSSEQQVIFDWMKKNLPQTKSIVHFAFGKAIVEDIKKKVMPTDKCYTFNGFGQSQIIKARHYQPLNKERDFQLVSDITGVNMADMDMKTRYYWYTVIKIVDACKREFIYPTTENLQFLLIKYPEIADRNASSLMLEDCVKLITIAADNKYGFNHTDQLWLGCLLTKKPVFDIGFVDEAQDQSRVCLELAKRSCKHLVYCGDPNQAIFAFAGADHEAFERVKSDSSLVLPLKLSFRCPPNICEKANIVRPTAKLRPLPEKQPGAEIQISESQLASYIVKTGQPLRSFLVVCRTNAPLIKLCLSFLNKGIPFFIINNDILKSLCYLVQNFKCTTKEQLVQSASSYIVSYRGHRNPIVELLAEEKGKTIIEIASKLKDSYSSNSALVKDFESNLNAMFKYTSKDNAIRGSTIHKAKGLENDNIVLLNPPPEHPLAAGNPIAMEQEKNLHFVAITRTKNTLIYCTLD